MKFAYVNSLKTEPFLKGRGECPCCGIEVVAKCGTKIVHHWAHSTLRHCDNWWENETLWHREWKSNFPASWQEIVHKDEVTGEKHVADVKLPNDWVLELQNSPMSLPELKSREAFYKKMIWIVNGEKFINQFSILDKLPDPSSKLAGEIGIIKSGYPLYYRHSEGNPDDIMRLIHSLSDIKDEIENNYTGHHLFKWIRPRTVWLDALAEVYIDLGNKGLFKLLKYDDRGLLCVNRIQKKEFIEEFISRK